MEEAEETLLEAFSDLTDFAVLELLSLRPSTKLSTFSKVARFLRNTCSACAEAKRLTTRASHGRDVYRDTMVIRSFEWKRSGRRAVSSGALGGRECLDLISCDAPNSFARERSTRFPRWGGNGREACLSRYCDLDRKKSGNGVLDVCLRFSCHQRQFQIYSDSYKKTRNGEFKCREKVDNPGLL